MFVMSCSIFQKTFKNFFEQTYNKTTMALARSFKSHFHLFLMSYFRVREHWLFGSR
jgi:hypothetical protein